MLIALTLYALFGMLDDYILPISKFQIWIIRYVFVVPIMAILILLSFLIKENKKHFQIIVLLFVSTGVIGLCVMIALFSPLEKGYHLYFIGLLAAMAWTQIIGFSHLTFTLISIGITVAYNIVAVFFQQLHVIDTPVFLFNNLFFITFGAFGFYSSRIIEQFVIADYRRTKELDFERSRLLENQRELADINLFKSKLLSVVSNDLRNPLSRIKEMLLSYPNEILSPEQFTERSANILNSIESLEILLDTTLIWSLTHSSEYTLDKKSIKLYQLINDTFQLMLTQTQHKSIVLQNAVDPKILVYADQNAVSIILRNLINSSLKYSTKGILIVKANSELDRVGITIHNNTTSQLTRDQFFKNRMVSTVASSQEGQAFGIRVCVELLNLHQGFLSYLNDEGEISFYFTLPASQE